MDKTTNPYAGHRYPTENIRHAVWLYFRFTLNGKHPYLWRAADQDGSTLDLLVQSRRGRNAAKRFFRKLPKGLCYTLSTT
jgi:transposase-like protein